MRNEARITAFYVLYITNASSLDDIDRLLYVLAETA